MKHRRVSLCCYLWSVGDGFLLATCASRVSYWRRKLGDRAGILSWPTIVFVLNILYKLGYDWSLVVLGVDRV
jgi:hypothetical protein